MGATLVLALVLTYSSELASPNCFAMLDVGQGQCLVYRGTGTAVIDCGANGDRTGETAARYLLSHGIFSLDRVIVSHLDVDHCGGVVQLISRIPTKTIYLPYREDEDESEAENRRLLCDAAEQYGATVQTVSETLALPAMTVFPPQSQKNANDACLAVLISQGDKDILITGDMSAATEAALIRNYDLPDLEVAVAGHHGAKNATGTTLLTHLRPEIVLCSAGKDNVHGHPADETVARVAENGGAFYTTIENGTMEIRW